MFDFFFFNDTATTEIYTLSLHDALPIFDFPDLRFDLPRSKPPIDDADAPFLGLNDGHRCPGHGVHVGRDDRPVERDPPRSEEHTSELQSHSDLVCRLLLEKKKTNITVYS